MRPLHNNSPGHPFRLWLEVGDLVDFLRLRDHVPAIQRVSLELIFALMRQFGGRVALCRLNYVQDRLEPVILDDLASSFERVLSAPRRGPLLRRIRWNLVNAVRRYALWLHDRIHDLQSTGNAVHAEGPNDIILNFSDSMLVRDYARRMARIKARYRMRFGLLVHDIIPITHPAFVHTGGHDVRFETWFRGMMAISDVVVVSSGYNLQMIATWAERQPCLLSLTPLVFRFGTGPATQLAQSSAVPTLPDRFVLFVSTIEIRKNHALLVEVWRHLIEKHGRTQIPDLVFVGKRGWKISDLIAKLQANRYLDGKVHIMSGLSDADVGEAYRQCLFTVFPSHCEGWGLPVEESFIHGKFCLASRGGSIPEVGGDLADYFDPSDVTDAFARIERAIFDPAYLTKRTERVRQQFRATSWDASAAQLVSAIDRQTPAKEASCTSER